VDNCPHIHNAGFFPDCCFLTVIYGCIWIPYVARYSEIFKKSNFQVLRWKSSLKNAELETEGPRLSTIFGSPPTPRLAAETHGHINSTGREEMATQLRLPPPSLFFRRGRGGIYIYIPVYTYIYIYMFAIMCVCVCACVCVCVCVRVYG